MGHELEVLEEDTREMGFRDDAEPEGASQGLSCQSGDTVLASYL